MVYNNDAEYHLNLMRESDPKYAAKRKRMQSNTAEPPNSKASAQDIDMDSETADGLKLEPEATPVPPVGPGDDDRAPSPALSNASSASEPPLAQKIKMNGMAHAKSAPPVSNTAPEEVSATTASISPPQLSPNPPASSAPPNSVQSVGSNTQL